MDKTQKGILGIGLIAVIALAFVFAASGSGAIEQNAEGDGGVTVAASAVTSSINYQGRLAGSEGESLSGTYDMTFRLYEVASGGTALDTDSHSVEVTEGLFNTNIDFDQSYFDGRELWLGITVGGEEMTPRQEFKPVPYALSLVPGANIIGSTLVALHAESTDTSGRGIRGYATATSGANYGVYGMSMSADGAGVYARGKDGGADLILGGNADTVVGDDGKIYSDPAYASSDIYLITNDGIRIDLDNDGDGEDADFEIRDKNGTLIFNVDESSGVYSHATATTGSNNHGVRAYSDYGYGVYGAGKYGGYFTTNQVGTPHAYTAGVNVSTAYDYSDGIRASTSGDLSDGIRASTEGVNSRGVSACTSGDSSRGVVVFTSGNGSNGVLAVTEGDHSTGVYAQTSGVLSTGIRASTSGDRSDGVYAHSHKSYGVYAITRSAGHAGVYAKGIDSGADLILGGNANTGAGDDGKIYSDPAYASSDIYLITNDGLRIDLDNDGDGEDADFEIRDKDNKLIFNVDESGDMYASGTKNAVVATKDYGTRKMYAIESTEVWFEDFGMTQLKDGVAVVEIDPVFAETVNLSVAYHVFFTPVDGWAPLFVTNKTSTSFELRDANDKADITLEYRIVAKRLGYEDVRMVQVEPGNEEA